MKTILTIIFLAASASVFAQKEKRVTPAYFMSGELTSADSFNRFLLLALPDFQFQSMDSSSKEKWDFMYKSGRNGSLKITYYTEGFTANNNAAAKTPVRKALSHVELRGDFPTLTKVYNKLFNSKTSSEDLLKQLPMRGPIYYGYSDYVWNKNNYWFSLGYFEGDGYCMLFRKIK